MSVFPDDSQPVPDGALTASGVKALQDVTEESARQQIRSQALVPWEDGRDNFFTNIIGGIGQAIKDGLDGFVSDVNNLFKPVAEGADAIRDGQLDLVGKQNQLDKLLHYGSVYATKNTGSNRAGTWHRMPFTQQISSEMRGCEVLPDGGIKLLEEGLWDIRGHVVAAKAAGLLDREVTVDLRVVDPDGETYSTMVGRISSKSADSIPIISSVQVPDVGYEVQVWIYSHNYTTGWGYGAAFSRLTVQQISSDDLSTGDGSSGNDEVEEVEDD